MKEILEVYHRGSGQLVNREKSAIFFSKNCDDAMVDEVITGLSIQNIALAEKYLGLPTALGRSTKETLNICLRELKALWGHEVVGRQAVQEEKSC